MSSDDEVSVDLRKSLPNIDTDVSASVRAKARQILEHRGVHAIGQEVTLQYQVTSPSGQDYRVVVGDLMDWITCDCPYGKRKPGRVGCSHALAVWNLLHDGGMPTEKKETEE